MQMTKLGRTDIEVSKFCLGSMTWGTQNTAAEGHAQIDYALANGINFVDTAEMYPVNPLSAETQGRTEEVIGEWFAKGGKRADMVLATKHSGNGIEYVREGKDFTAESIPLALEGSLKRLKTDYVDLYQFHWPNRGSYMFRKNWTFDPSSQNRAETIQNIEDCLGALQIEVDKGRIRAFGMSNDSAWGLTQWANAAERVGGPRIATVQNEYSLMCRLADTDVAEVCHNEDIGMLSFSPLAAGLLTGKYQRGEVPEGSRMSLNGELGGRKTPRAFEAVDAYLGVAKKHGLDPVQMAMAFVRDRLFMASAIFGATSLEQLKRIIAGADLVLGEEVMADIDAAHRAHPMPY
ncbi:aldo/keto reductase [Sulfitobacter guttiformis]|uniref:Aryl-alcohol dehydrogenase-like predicted oxidoreductase n=1 Tax=Sulfitobacter guttiformis TaxID=74349 RepID=A0A420DNS1_9RHOB|nr:aldo/keto reductase [Sulfitobacter guttiformis]KIN73229.1 Oxidoreductase [Sulfitobacter guttiformis KCTC 32187]RKE95902.1 aryl-alcohol dehydrogenase-like predicted oxidoreductase [Sulfitobacter guttiformis]